MVEQEAVNFEVAGSSPASRANEKRPSLKGLFSCRGKLQSNRFSLRELNLSDYIKYAFKRCLYMVTLFA